MTTKASMAKKANFKEHKKIGLGQIILLYAGSLRAAGAKPISAGGTVTQIHGVQLDLLRFHSRLRQAFHHMVLCGGSQSVRIGTGPQYQYLHRISFPVISTLLI